MTVPQSNSVTGIENLQRVTSKKLRAFHINVRKTMHIFFVDLDVYFKLKALRFMFH